MPLSSALDDIQLRRADTNERFVAFAFAGADMVLETDLAGVIAYAAGAYRTLFGAPPEAFIGRNLRTLIAPVDHETLESVFLLLNERGRVPPLVIRMADADRTRLVLAAIALPTPGNPARFCMTLGRPPVPLSSQARVSSPDGFARAAEARLRAGEGCGIRLLEIVGPNGVALLQREAIGLALEKMAPNAVASELAPGRFGVLGAETAEFAVLGDPMTLEAILRAQGMEVAVTSRRLSPRAEGLTPRQTARALRHALSVFAREGTSGVEEAGLGGGLSGYLDDARRKADKLRRAIRGGHFSLAFQPIVALADRAAHHYEALIRPSPIEGLPLANPQEFVMLVEALGLASELDLAVARMACTQAARAGLKVAFNLSGQSVQDGEFRTRLMALLSESLACKAGLILVEMTETAEIEAIDEALHTADALRAAGVPFCLDDFGAGNTDMQLLRTLKPNIVKLDGSYVPGIAAAGRERAFVAGMVEMARAVGADMVAERIETEAECAALRALGVQFGQGWLFAHPGPLPAVAARAARAAR